MYCSVPDGDKEVLRRTFLLPTHIRFIVVQQLLYCKTIRVLFYRFDTSIPLYIVQCKSWCIVIILCVYRVCTDQCKKEGTTMYKYNDLNRCSAYLECQDGRAVARCCPDGHAFHPRQGCIKNEKCVDLCPFRDRVPGETRPDNPLF